MRIASTTIAATCAAAAIAAATPAVAQQQYMDEEFYAQWGLAAIGAQYALAAGYTGTGIGVVVVDGLFQVSHEEFVGRVGDYSYDPIDVGYNGHGTGVAGIIGAARNDEGMEGVAPNVTLNAIALFNSAGTRVLNNAQLAEGYNGALDAGLRIFNNSWGASNTASGTIDKFTVESAQDELGPVLGALQRSVDLGAIQVWATMNAGQPQPSLQAGLPYLFPSLQSGWIAVTSVDRNMQRASDANACGVAAQWCLAAPGVGVYSTQTPDTYGTFWGTSFAAPQVTGAVAIAKEMFPNAKGSDVARMVLVTAKDIGVGGVDDIFGWGMLSVANIVGMLGDGLGGPGNDDEDGSDNGLVFVNSAFARFAAVDTLVSTLWDRSAQRILSQGGTSAPSFAAAMAAVPATPAMALGGPVRDDVDSTVTVSTGRSAAVWAQGLGAHASLNGSPKSSADLGGAIGGYDLFDNGNVSGGIAIAFTQSNLDTEGTGDDSSAEGWHGFAYATWKDDNWFLDGIAGGNWFSNDYKRTTIGGTSGTVLGNAGIAGHSNNDTSGFAGRLTGGHVFGLGANLVAPYAYATVIHQRTGGSTETGADIFSLDINATSLDQVEGGAGVRSQLGGIAWHAFTITPSVDLAYGRLGGDVNLPVGFELLGTPLSANIADLGRDVFRVGAQLDVMRFDEMVGGFVSYDGRFQENARNNSFSGGVLVRF
jgi:subtilase-type serine protease